MPSPRGVYSGIASAVAMGSPASYVTAGGQPQRVRRQVTWQGVQQLDRVIQQALDARPGASYEQVLRDLRIDGQPLDESLLLAARQLREARRQRLLRPGDENL